MKGADPRLIPGPQGLTPARLVRVLLIGCAMALVFGARPLADWAGRLPPGWESVQVATAWWADAMARIGLGAPYDALHQLVRRWSGG